MKENYKSDFITLAEAGFIAVNQADEDSSRKLFAAAKLLDEKNCLPIVGMGYLHLHKLEIKEAIKYFEMALKVEPKNEMAKTLLGVAMTFSTPDVSKGEKILEETKKSSDPLIKNLSKSSIDFVEKFVKKAASPVEVQKPKQKPAK